MHRHAIEPWLEERWAWLALHRYHLWFALAALPDVVAASVVEAFDPRTFRPMIYAPLGWLRGGALRLWLYQNLRTDSWPLAVMMPVTFAFPGGVIAARLVAWPRKLTHLRGTRMRMFNGGPRRIRHPRSHG